MKVKESTTKILLSKSIVYIIVVYSNSIKLYEYRTINTKNRFVNRIILLKDYLVRSIVDSILIRYKESIR